MSKKKETAEELNLNENDLADWAEKQLGHLKPYASHIALAVAVGFLGFIGITYFIDGQRRAYSDQWRELAVATTDFRISNNTTRLLNVAEDYPNQKAAMWSLQIAGDADLQSGLAQLSYDREGGFAIIKRAKENLQKVVDASSALKTDELQQRALFSLAYACESLGDFEGAAKNYQSIIDGNADSAFVEPAKRGLSRSKNPELIALYDKFKNWKDLAEDAPGPNVPDVPNIDFPEIDGEGGGDAGGGDFEGGTESTETSSTEGDSDETSNDEPVNEGEGGTEEKEDE